MHEDLTVSSPRCPCHCVLHLPTVVAALPPDREEARLTALGGEKGMGKEEMLAAIPAQS